MSIAIIDVKDYTRYEGGLRLQVITLSNGATVILWYKDDGVTPLSALGCGRVDCKRRCRNKEKLVLPKCLSLRQHKLLIDLLCL